MLAIGNGEPCPFCHEMQTPNDSETTFKHIEVKHPKELEEALFGKNAVKLEVVESPQKETKA